MLKSYPIMFVDVPLLVAGDGAGARLGVVFVATAVAGAVVHVTVK